MTDRLPRRPKAVVFDMDGVLIDSEPLWHEAEMTAFAGRGVVLTRADCQQTTGVRIDAVVRHWAMQFPALTGVDHDAIVAEIITGVVDRIAARGTAIPGAIATLRAAVEAGMPVGVASSSPPHVIASALARLGIADHFGAVCSAWELPFPKPDPAVYLQACAALGVAPADAVAIEDSHSGLLAGLAAGMMVVAFVDGRSPTPPAAEGADLVVSDLGQLPALLLRR